MAHHRQRRADTADLLPRLVVALHLRHDRHRLRGAVALDLQVERLARMVFHEIDEARRAADRLAVERDQLVAGLQAGLLPALPGCTDATDSMPPPVSKPRWAMKSSSS